MSRLLLLSILVLWMCPRDNVHPLLTPGAAIPLFLGIYALLVGAIALWSQRLARRVADDLIGRTLDRYNHVIEIARYFIPAWFAVGIFALGWGHYIYGLLEFIDPALPHTSEMRLTSENYWRVPALLLGTLPALAAWMGLWWAQYPADRALKEHSLLARVDEGLPVHSPPGLFAFFVEHFRQQLVFTLAPVLLIVLARDLLALGWLTFASRPMPRDGGDWVIIPFTLALILLAPEVLRRLIPTRTMPPHWPLRQRLESLCRRAGLQCRDILIWQTNSSVGNAMVMGLFPRVRYVFLSDLLLETMSDEEIEAVFAHEIGHIVHRHMWWYLVFIAVLMLLVAGPLALTMAHIPALARSADLQAQVSTVLGLVLFAGLFGFFSRRFERQADVYAARTMQSRHSGPMTIRHYNPEIAVAGGLFVQDLVPAAVAVVDLNTPADPPPGSVQASYVGEYGAAVVSSALRRVARVNNIPIAAHEWLHGSIERRMRYLKDLSGDRSRTAHFDRFMRRLYWSLVAVLVMLGTWFCLQYGLTGLSGTLI